MDKNAFTEPVQESEFEKSKLSLEKLYYDPLKAASYSGQRHLIRAARGNVTRNDVKRWLEEQDAYTLHRPVRKKFPRRMYSVFDMDAVWEADLADLSNIKRFNDNITFLLVVIDVFSKFLWVEPLRNKTAGSVAKAFEIILQKSGNRIPRLLQTDKGKEFLGSEMQNLLKKYNVQFRVVRSPDVKAAVAERVIRTLKERIWRYFTHKNTKKYIDVLQSIVYAYNHSIHTTIKMLPAEVNLETSAVIRNAMYHKKKLLNAKIKTPKYSVGDVVRISTAKGIFTKAYTGGWSKELFIISRILKHRFPIVYVVKDLADEEIHGFFYEQELGLVRKNLQTEEYQIDRIIRTKKKSGSTPKLLYVSWKGYPDKFNSWIPASSVVNYNHG